MSRYCGERVSGPIFEAAEHWKNASLLGQKSLLGTEALWMRENNFVDQPDLGAGAFLEVRMSLEVVNKEDEAVENGDGKEKGRQQAAFFEGGAEAWVEDRRVPGQGNGGRLFGSEGRQALPDAEGQGQRRRVSDEPEAWSLLSLAGSIQALTSPDSRGS